MPHIKDHVSVTQLKNAAETAVLAYVAIVSVRGLIELGRDGIVSAKSRIKKIRK